MGRPRRSEQQHGYFHVMNRGVDHGRTFFDDADRVDFGACLGDAVDEVGIEVHAYCLMANHFHLVLHCPDGGLSQFVQRLVARHTRHVNDRRGRDGPLYRGRFRSLAITDDAYLLAVVRYVHRNVSPDDDEAVDRYRWSSHRTYLGVRRPVPWLRTDAVLGLVGGLGGYRALMATSSAPHLGPAAVLPPRSALDLAVDEHEQELSRSTRGLDRTVALALVRRGTWSPGALDDLALRFDDRRAYLQASSRAGLLVDRDPVLAAIADRAAQLAV